MSLPVFLFYCLYCGLGVLASSPGPPNTDTADDEPDLLHMLDYFKGKSDMSLLLNFMKEFKFVKAFGNGIMDICPTCQQVYQQAAASNVGFRILYKIVEGKNPDIKDLYDLATKGPGDMKEALYHARKKNKQYDTLVRLLTQGNSTMLSSALLLEEFLTDMTGQHFSIDPVLVKEVKDGTVTLTETNIVQANLLELMSTVGDNMELVDRFSPLFLKPPFNFVNLLHVIGDLDFAHLSKIKSITGGVNNSSKYSVTGEKVTYVTDPGVLQLSQDQQKAAQLMKQKSTDQTEAESLLVESAVDFMNLASRVIKDAENGRIDSSH